MNTKIELKFTVVHPITGFKGTVTGRCEYLSGKVIIEVTSSGLSDGRVVREWFDESELEII